MHDGAPGALRRHLPGRGLEHVHRHPAEECPQLTDQHGGRAHRAGAAEDERRGRHDSRYEAVRQGAGSA